MISMKSFRKLLSLLMVVVLLAGFMLVPGHSAQANLQPGDINGDGKVNVGDVSRLYSHIRGIRLITDLDALSRADLTGDGKLNIGDTARVYSLVRTTTPPSKTNVTLTVWVPSEDLYGYDTWILQMEESFEKAHPEYNITWVNDVCYEGDAGGAVSTDPENAADVYLFCNDQVGTLNWAGALTALEGKYLEQVLTDNSQTLVNTVTDTDGQVYGFPISNNTWFMYYNKSVFSYEDVKSLDTMLTKGRVAFPMSSPWYGGTFFLANGGQIFGEKGIDASAGIQFGYQNGGDEAALKMIQLVNNPNFLNDVDSLGWYGMREGDIDAYFSGSWDYAALKESLGDDLGVVQLPTVEIGGEQKQMLSFAGSKAVGVNPHADNQEVAMEFASFLASPAGQKLRYLISGVIPAAKELANDPQVSANPVAVAEINTMLNASVMQPTLFAMGNYWTPMTNFGCGIACGEINESNYMEYVDQMMSQFGNIEPAEEYEIANVQYPGGGSGSITLRIHYNRPDGNYTDWNVWLWDNSAVTATYLNPPYEFEDINGEMVCTVKINSGTSEVGYVIRLGDWIDKDIHEDRFIDLAGIVSGTVDVYIQSQVWSHEMVLNDDVVLGNLPFSLDYTHSKKQLVLGLAYTADEAPAVTITGSNGNVAITRMTRVDYNYYLTLEEPLAPGHYTLTCDTDTTGIIEFDII